MDRKARRFALMASVGGMVVAATLGLSAPVCVACEQEDSLEVTVKSAQVILVPTTLPGGAPAKQEQFAVEVQVRDRSDADIVQICEERTLLLGEAGQVLGKLRTGDVEYSIDGPLGWTERPKDPREFTAQLRFFLPEGAQPSMISLRVNRYQSREITVEWADGGFPLDLPLKGKANDLSLAIETMTRGTAEEPGDAEDLIVSLTGTATPNAVSAPDLKFVEISMVTSEGTVLSTKRLHGQINRTGPLEAEGACKDDIKVWYHFSNVAEIPDVSKIALLIQAAEPLDTLQATAAIPRD